MEETREGIVRQNVVREYMIARRESFKESTILSAWEKSGIRPLNPSIFDKDDYGPSYASSINPPLPDSFPVLATAAGNESLPDSPDNEPNRDGDEESDEDEGEDGDEDNEESDTEEVALSEATPDHAPDLLNRGISLDQAAGVLPILVPLPTLPTQQIFFDAESDVLREEGRDSPPQLGNREIEHRRESSNALSTPIHIGHHQTRSMLRSASSISGSQSMEEQLSDSKQKVQALTESLDAALAWGEGGHFKSILCNPTCATSS
ncbi:hypothetical protein EDB83DRAFT_2322290 [Lactarius deliciosus]|nr:hypothetical protein EDB83DRAFT_2322290 [Lactarius deliciosus]